MRRAVISGVTGHVGRELARQLASAGVEVHGLTRQRIWTLDAPDGVLLHQVNCETETLVAVLSDVCPDTVFHLAALARREHRIEDVAPFVSANVLLGTQLLEAARQCGCRRFITAGSYLQHTETGAYRAFNLYAATKQAFEDVLTYYGDAFSFATAVLTLCNVYSEHDTRPTLIADMATACAAGAPITLHAEEVWIDPVHVEDVAAAFQKVASLLEEDTVHRGELSHYSVTSGREVSSLVLAALFEKLSHKRLIINRGPTRFAARRLKPWRGTTVPQWMPRVTLEEGLARIWERARRRAPT